MSQPNEISIEEKSTIYDVSMTYHSDMKCENYDVSIECFQYPNGKVSVKPGNTFFADDGFKFLGSDPDRVIAIAQMMMAFAHMVKNENKKRIDVSDNEC